MIRVLIADDHAVVREGLARMLAATGDIEATATASTATELIQQLHTTPCDVVLMDMSMPGMNGLEALKLVKTEHPRLPVLLFSMHPEEQYALRCLKAGAAGYLNKACEKSELLAAIHCVAEGKKYISRAVSNCMAGEMQGSTHTQHPHQSLSDREYEVFELIAQGVSPGDMAKQLKLSPKTVSTYRERVLLKMGMDTNAALMRYAFENKLVE